MEYITLIFEPYRSTEEFEKLKFYTNNYIALSAVPTPEI